MLGTRSAFRSPFARGSHAGLDLSHTRPARSNVLLLLMHLPPSEAIPTHSRVVPSPRLPCRMRRRTPPDFVSPHRSSHFMTAPPSPFPLAFSSSLLCARRLCLTPHTSDTRRQMI